MFALRPQSARLAGATLVEMVLAVAVLGIVVLVAIPRSDPVGSFATEAVAAEIANALRFGQQEAIRTGRYHRVQIDTVNQTLSVSRLTETGPIGRDNGFTVLHPLERREYLIRLANNSFPSPTVVGSIFQYSGSPSTDYASFGPDGLPMGVSGVWNNGVPTNRTPLEGNGVVTIRHGQVERRILLNPVTGRVTY
jgi:Tfp pilus assembly protein FimT